MDENWHSADNGYGTISDNECRLKESSVDQSVYAVNAKGKPLQMRSAFCLI